MTPLFFVYNFLYIVYNIRQRLHPTTASRKIIFFLQFLTMETFNNVMNGDITKQWCGKCILKISGHSTQLMKVNNVLLSVADLNISVTILFNFRHLFTYLIFIIKRYMFDR